MKFLAANMAMLVAAAGLAAAQQTPPRHTHPAHGLAHRVLRTPPRAATEPANGRAGRGSEPAPMPNEDVQAPAVPENRAPHLAPALFHLNNNYIGDGYPYGSSPQGMDDRRAATIPGLELRMPVH